MKIDDAIAAIKEFFLEVLGFLLPGFILLLLIYLFLKEEFKIDIDILLSREQSNTIVLVISYITGYVLYGISESWGSLRCWLVKQSYKIKKREYKPIEDSSTLELKNSPDYKVALGIINEKLGIERNLLDGMPFRSVRNIAMSFIPEADRKIYTFMFRSELSEKTSVGLFLIFCIGILSFGLERSKYFIVPFKSDSLSISLYFLVLIVGLFLRETHKRFYDIAMKIAIPMFVVKHKMEAEKKKEGNEQA